MPLEIEYTTYKDYQKAQEALKVVPEVERTPEEIMDIKFRRAIKKLRTMEKKERPRPKRTTQLHEDERIRLTQRRHYLAKLHRGEISIHSLPQKYFPEYFKISDHKVSDMKNWKDHIHHHLRVEYDEELQTFSIYCDTCNGHGKEPITRIYKEEDEWYKYFKRSGKYRKNQAFVICQHCKCQISIKQFYRQFQLGCCVNCESPYISRVRNLELHDPKLFKQLHDREIKRIELAQLIIDKEKELNEYAELDNRQIILTKYPKITKDDYESEKNRSSLRIVFRPEYLESVTFNTNDHIYPAYDKTKWEETRKLKKRGPKFRLNE